MVKKLRNQNYKVTLASGEVIILEWGELCEIAHFVHLEEASEEVSNSLDCWGEYDGINLTEKRLDPKFVEDVAHALIQVRLNNETTDDVFDALVAVFNEKE